MLLRKLILFIAPCVSGSLNFIIFFHFPILKELYTCLCFVCVCVCVCVSEWLCEYVSQDDSYACSRSSFVVFLCQVPYNLHTIIPTRWRNTAVGTDFALVGWAIMFRLSSESRNYLFSQTSRPALCPAQSHLRCSALGKSGLRFFLGGGANMTSYIPIRIYGMYLESFTFTLIVLVLRPTVDARLSVSQGGQPAS